MEVATQKSSIQSNSPINPSTIDSSPQKATTSLPRKRKLSLILFVVFIVAIVLPVGGWWYRVRVPNPPELSAPTIPVATVAPVGFTLPTPLDDTLPSPISYNYATTLTELPVLFPELSWQEVDPRNSRMKEYEVLYVTNDEGSYSYSGVKLPGKEWTTQKSYTADEGWTTISQNLMKYFEDNFSKIGWGSRVQLPGYTLQASAADGPLGSVWGFVGVKDMQVRVVTFEEVRSDNGQGVCPCKLTYWVNISEITPFEEVLTLLRSN